MIGGKTYGLISALVAFPRRLAAREVARQGGEFQHRVTRRTSHIVFGRTLLRGPDNRLEGLVNAHRISSQKLLSEKSFLRELGLLKAVEYASLSRNALLEQAGLSDDIFDALALFDAFEHQVEPFPFSDAILARKYSALLNSGGDWKTIVRSIHRSAPSTSLTALTLHSDSKNIMLARHGEELTELDGQRLFWFDTMETEGLEDLFVSGEEAEEAGNFKLAAELYGQCLALDPKDAIAEFNRANCLREIGAANEAESGYLRAIKLDPKFAEAWFNLSELVKGAGRTPAARSFLIKAINADSSYADPVYNLASLEFDDGRYSEARKWWSRYLELDENSDWAAKASKGLQLIEQIERRCANS